MIVREIYARSILSKSKVFDYVVNPYIGCQHGCQNVVKEAGFECEPRRTRTSNRLIKRLKILFTVLFNK